ncbi:MAG: hypothetical protein AAF791_05490 [Bacteroidota bacterium]
MSAPLRLALVAMALASAAAAQSPLTDGTGVHLLVAEFNEGGPMGSVLGTEPLGGIESPDHLFGVDVTALRRWNSGLALGLRGGVYRYDPVGLGGRLGLLGGWTRSAAGVELRTEAEVALLGGRFERDGLAVDASGVQADLAVLAQRTVPLIGSVDLRATAGPYAALTQIGGASNPSDPARDPTEAEGFGVQTGVQVGAAVTFALLDARVALAPVTRIPLSGERATFSAIPGGGLWVDF